MPSAEYWSWVQNNYGSDAGGTQGQQLPAEFIDHEDLDQLDNDDSTEDVSQSLCSEDQQSLDDVFSATKVGFEPRIHSIGSSPGKNLHGGSGRFRPRNAKKSPQK